MATLTPRKLELMKPGQWLSDGASRGAGTLAARRTSDRVLLYFRYTGSEGQREAVPLGEWSKDGKGRGLTLMAARDKASELSVRYRNGDRDLRAVLDAEVREAARRREVDAAHAAAAAARQRATLGALLMAYVAQLGKAGKASQRSVERALERNVRDAWPVLWAMPADEVTTEDLLAVVAKPADAGKLREAAKVRSYIQAAYASAIGARQSALALPALRDLKISSNPARNIASITGSSTPRERALSVAELRAYWARIKALPDPDGALLRFHLLTGAQRIEQLGRLVTSDFDRDTMTVRLRDGKGRRKAARSHVVPLLPSALAAMEGMQGGTVGPFLFTVTGGASGAVYATVRHRLASVLEAMTAAGELSEPFTPGDIRRTVETRLAALGVSAEVRAQLQSHGLGGVQARHYDRHSYSTEKLEALRQLEKLLGGKPGTVTPIARTRRKEAAKK